MDSLRTVRDSVTLAMLGPEYTVRHAADAGDLYDSQRWFEARPVAIYRDGAAGGEQGS